MISLYIPITTITNERFTTTLIDNIAIIPIKNLATDGFATTPIDNSTITPTNGSTMMSTDKPIRTSKHISTPILIDYPTLTPTHILTPSTIEKVMMKIETNTLIVIPTDNYAPILVDKPKVPPSVNPTTTSIVKGDNA